MTDPTRAIALLKEADYITASEDYDYPPRVDALIRGMAGFIRWMGEPSVASGEVVAWMADDGRLINAKAKAQSPAALKGSFCIPLYTHPAPPARAAVVEGFIKAALAFAAAHHESDYLDHADEEATDRGEFLNEAGQRRYDAADDAYNETKAALMNEYRAMLAAAPSPPPSPQPQPAEAGKVDVAPASRAAVDVLAERQRQISAEGWTPEHDDEHDTGELAIAAGCYAIHAHQGFTTDDYCNDGSPAPWPWGGCAWKPKDARRDLVRAGALILAEIERLDRLAAKREGCVCAETSTRNCPVHAP